MAFNARPCCPSSMTHEMLRSEAPCAIALTLMLLRPSESNTLPDTPGRPFIPSPTTARIACSGLWTTNISRSSDSCLNSRSMAKMPRFASAARTAKQMVCSDDACEIRMMFTRSAASVLNSRSAMPGTPTIPGPDTVSSDSPPTVVIPFASASPSLRFVRHLRQHERRRHELGVGAQHAVDVRPDLDEVGVHRGADDRRAVVRAVPPDGCGLAVYGRPDESGHDRNRRLTFAQERAKLASGQPVGRH